MTFYKKLLLFVLVACLVRESWSSVWGPKDSDGQRNLQLFDLDPNGLLQDELRNVANQAKRKESR